MVWNVRKLVRSVPRLKDPILIEGLPGIGNVGKIAVDFMIDELKAVKFLEIQSYSLPHSVFVDHQNVIKLPVIEMFYKRFRGRKHDLLFLAGDIQPIDEVSTYEFCEKVLDLAVSYNVEEIVTIGGIGLAQVPERPKVYCTGNSGAVMKKYKQKTKLQDKLYGVVGPIIGVTGVLVGLAAQRKMPAVCLLAETYGHPFYLGVKGSQEVLKVLNQKLALKLDLNALSEEIADVEEEIIRRAKQANEVGKQTALRKFRDTEASYIG